MAYFSFPKHHSCRAEACNWIHVPWAKKLNTLPPPLAAYHPLSHHQIANKQTPFCSIKHLPRVSLLELYLNKNSFTHQIFWHPLFLNVTWLPSFKRTGKNRRTEYEMVRPDSREKAIQLMCWEWRKEKLWMKKCESRKQHLFHYTHFHFLHFLIFNPKMCNICVDLCVILFLETDNSFHFKWSQIKFIFIFGKIIHENKFHICTQAGEWTNECERKENNPPSCCVYVTYP